MKTNAMTSVLCAVSLSGLAAAAQADQFFGTDTTINSAIAGNTYTGYSNFNDYVAKTNGSSPTITLVPGAALGNDLITASSSTVNITGGSIGNFLRPQENSIVNFSGGTLARSINSFGHSITNVSGGSGFGIGAFGSSVINISGGLFSGPYNAQETGTLNIFGTGLTYSQDSTNAFGTNYSLSGALLDGTVLTNKSLFIATGANFAINPTGSAVPEPGSVALLVGAGSVSIGLLRRRRK